MGMMEGFRNERGQMTIELAIAFPVLIAVAVIAVNVLAFFGDCAVFDRVAHEAVRVYAVAPAHRETANLSCPQIEATIKSQLNASNLDVAVTHATTGLDLDEFTATLTYHPTLFGLGLRSKVFGVSLPQLTHKTRYVVDSYRAGVFI